MAWLIIGAAATLAALAAGAIYQQLGSRHDRAVLPPPGRLVDIGGRRLHIYGLGKGPPTVVFEAGLAASSLSWRPVHEAVSRFAMACAYDRAGYGWSDRASGSRTARASARDLHRLLAAAGLVGPFVLVSHSFGAYVATVFSVDHGADVAGLVLLDPITADEWRAPDRDQRRLLVGGRLFSAIGAMLAAAGVVRLLLNRTRAGGTAMPGLVLRLFGRRADLVVRRILGEVTKMPPELWPAVQAHWSRAPAFLTMAAHFRALPASAAEVDEVFRAKRPALGEVPLIVVSAADAPADRLAAHRRLAESSSRGRHLQASIGGHWVHLDDPQVVVDAIRRLSDDPIDVGSEAASR